MSPRPHCFVKINLPCSRSRLRLRGRPLRVVETLAVEQGLAPEEVLNNLLSSALSLSGARLAPSPSWRALTKRERQIVLLILKEYSDSHIARELQINRETVRSHVRSIFHKYGVHSRAELRRQIDQHGGPFRSSKSRAN